jgi:hypothetical protein
MAVLLTSQSRLIKLHFEIDTVNETKVANEMPVEVPTKRFSTVQQAFTPLPCCSQTVQFNVLLQSNAFLHYRFHQGTHVSMVRPDGNVEHRTPRYTSTIARSNTIRSVERSTSTIACRSSLRVHM